MDPRLLIAIITLVLTMISGPSEAQQKEAYVGAVVEYKPVGSPWDSSPEELLRKNTNKYVELIGDAAKHNADIIVFPEYGLTTLGIPRERENARPYLQIVPEIGQNPCLGNPSEDIFSSAVIRNLSCGARANHIYVVVNLGELQPCQTKAKYSYDNDCSRNLNGLPYAQEAEDPCPPDNAFHYNTNVVFDREGVVIAKYHKYQLYFEDQFDSPSRPDYSTFDTDFGVTFGTFTCFDIIFYQPAVHQVANGVRNFVFPSAWVDELPFLTAPQAHSIWTMGANVTLLASGYHQPLGGQLGSGIYSGPNTLNYTFDPDSGTRLILSEIPILPQNPAKTVVKLPANKSRPKLGQYHSFLKEDLGNYSTIVLTPGVAEREETACQDQFCCSLKYSMVEDPTAEEPGNYRLLAFDGIRKTAQETEEFGWEVCGVIRCLNVSLSSCTERDTESGLTNFNGFELSSSSFNFEGVMRPSLSTLDTGFKIIPFESFTFGTTEGVKLEGAQANRVVASSRSLANVSLQTVAIINRTYPNKK